MKKVWITFAILLTVLINEILCLGIKKHFENKINSSNEYQLAYNDIKTNNDSINYIEKETKLEEKIDESLIIPEQETTSVVTKTMPITTSETTTTTTSEITTKATETFQNEVEIKKVEDDGSIIYEGMTLSQLTDKLNKNLNSTVTNTGVYFAEYYKKTGLDPYLSIAIVLHETGCKWTCSKLVRECNNIGGLKGGPSCGGGSYKKYETLEEGIEGYLDILYNNYWSRGLNTAELMQSKYAPGSETWTSKINSYIESIRNS